MYFAIIFIAVVNLKFQFVINLSSKPINVFVNDIKTIIASLYIV